MQYPRNDSRCESNVSLNVEATRSDKVESLCFFPKWGAEPRPLHRNDAHIRNLLHSSKSIKYITVHGSLKVETKTSHPKIGALSI